MAVFSFVKLLTLCMTICTITVTEKGCDIMKKAFTFLLIMLITVMLVCFSASAEDKTEKILIKDSCGDIVKTYDVVINNKNVDARKAIQYAIDYIRDNASEEDIHTLILPEGKYGLHSSLNFYSNMVFDMSQSEFYRMGNCSAMIRFGRSSEIYYGDDGFTNITLKNGCIDGNDNGTTSLMRFAHAKNITLENIVFRNTYDVHHQLTFAASSNVKIVGCEFTNMDFSKKSEGYNCEAIQIDILKEEHFSYPSMDGTGTKNVEISECSFKKLSRGVGTHSGVAGHYLSNIKIIDNTFSDITGYAISALNYKNSKIIRNKITDCGSGIFCSTVPSGGLEHMYAPFNEKDKINGKLNVEISENSISLKDKGYGRTSFGIKLLGSDIKKYKDKNGKTVSGNLKISGVTVKNNTVTSSISKDNFYAITVSYAYGSEYSSKSNLSITGNKVVFSNSKKCSNTNHGIRIENSSKIYVSKNNVYDKSSSAPNLNSGIYVKSCSYIQLVSNTVKNTKETGIKATTLSEGLIKSNSVTNTKDDGIYIYSDSDGIEVTSNITKSTKGDGIAVKDSEASKISSNKVYSSNGYGINFAGDSTSSSISSNYICNSKSGGILLNNTSYVTSVSKNKIDIASSSADGITVKSSAGVKKINSNQINLKKNSDSKDLKVKCRNGILVNSKSCKISEIKGNSIKSCAEKGIYIASAKTSATVSGNSINSCRYGIVYSKGSLSDNTVKNYSKSKYQKL